eukprot:scaffold183014_cov19-Tisochrysis_lutea.AAC.2
MCCGKQCEISEACYAGMLRRKEALAEPVVLFFHEAEAWALLGRFLMHCCLLSPSVHSKGSKNNALPSCIASPQPGLEDKVETSWTSPLAGKPNQHFRVKGLKNEAAMKPVMQLMLTHAQAASLLASSLQIYAHAQLKGSSSSQDQGSSQAASHPSAGSGQAHDHQQQPQSEEGAACAAAALHFRQAA